MTGSAGGCTLNNVSDGSQTVTVSAVGYTAYTGSISVSEDNISFEVTLTPIVYDFISYGDSGKSEELATGTVTATGKSTTNYVEMEVLTNSEDGWVGNKYYVTNEAIADGTTAYQLYSDAGTTGTGIYVTITMHE